MRHSLCILALSLALASCLPVGVSSAAEPAAAAPEPNPIVWGKKVDQLQAGLRMVSKLPCRVGEMAEWQIVLRNVGDEQVRVSYVPPSAFLGHLQNQQLRLSPVGIGKGFETTHTLQPGGELTFGVSLLFLPPKPPQSPARPWLEVVPGKYQVSAPSVLLRRDGSDGKLGTGTIELEILPVAEQQP